MVIDADIRPMDPIRRQLGGHSFVELFIESLGWDRATAGIEISVEGRRLAFRAVAQKRGLQVFHCATDRQVLFDRGFLRRVQRRMARECHEHILIYSCDKPPKQVWQWAIQLPDGDRLRHREHPFFSGSPPEPFVERLTELRFTLDEEEAVGLVDALERVRRALDTRAELNLFVKRPRFASRSDELARLIQAGDRTAFDEFVILHVPLARRISKRLCRWFDMDPDDAEQIALLGLIAAAERYQPERGYQFSTYATHWIRQAVQRHGPDAAMFIRIPQHVFWKCFRLRYDRDFLAASHGARDGGRRFQELHLDENNLREQWCNFERAWNVRSIDDRLSPERREAREIVQPESVASVPAESASTRMLVAEMLRALPARQATILRLRYGLDGPALTLEQVAEQLFVTRERVRQIQKKVEEKLRSSWEVRWETGEARAQRRSANGSATAPTDATGEDPPEPTRKQRGRPKGSVDRKKRRKRRRRNPHQLELFAGAALQSSRRKS